MILLLKEYISFSYGIVTPWLIRIGISVGIFLVFFLLRKYSTTKIMALLLKATSRTETELDDYLVMSLEKPLQLLFLALGFYLALIYLPLSMEADIFIAKLFRTTIVILVSLVFWNVVDNYSQFADEIRDLASVKIDQILIPFISRTLKIIIVALALVVILQEWEYDISGFIAGLGLGGLALALAAQQTLSNVFGGFVILTDKPFSIGDWILTPSVEGTVEDINFRSTKIRTFAQAVVTVPNSTLANEPITNWTRMGKRRITFILGVIYSTPKEKLERCVKEIRNMLHNHPEIHPETIFVNFDSFGESGLNIFLYFFTRTTVWGDFLEVKEDVNLKIMEILEREGVTLALPSTSIYFENELPTFPNNSTDQDSR